MSADIGYKFAVICLVILLGLCYTADCSRCNAGTEYACSNGKCIPSTLTNNSVNDCGDNSDEVPFPCRYPMYSCLNNRCIIQPWVLDGTNDCLDASDEVKLIGTNCSTAKNCCFCQDFVPHSECRQSICQCLPGFYSNKLGTKCIRREIGDDCRKNVDCSAAVNHSMCSSTGVCECLDGYWGSNDNKICIQRHYGDGCVEDRDCAAIPYSMCKESRCICRTGYKTISSSESSFRAVRYRRELNRSSLRSSRVARYTNLLKKSASLSAQPLENAISDLHLSRGEMVQNYRKIHSNGEKTTRESEMDRLANNSEQNDLNSWPTGDYRHREDTSVKTLFSIPTKTKHRNVRSIENGSQDALSLLSTTATTSSSNDAASSKTISRLSYSTSTVLSLLQSPSTILSTTSSLANSPSSTTCIPPIVGDPCKADIDCSGLKESICSNEECACDIGRVTSRSGRKCRPLRVGDRCSSDINCTRGASLHTKCNSGICECIVGFKQIYTSGECVSEASKMNSVIVGCSLLALVILSIFIASLAVYMTWRFVLKSRGRLDITKSNKTASNDVHKTNGYNGINNNLAT